MYVCMYIMSCACVCIMSCAYVCVMCVCVGIHSMSCVCVCVCVCACVRFRGVETMLVSLLSCVCSLFLYVFNFVLELCRV
jgi:hypothetical protein